MSRKPSKTFNSFLYGFKFLKPFDYVENFTYFNDTRQGVAANYFIERNFPSSEYRLIISIILNLILVLYLVNLKIKKMENKWYDKTWVIVVSGLLFPPLGIYVVYKNSRLSSGVKVGIYVAMVLWFVAIINGQKNEQSEQSISKTDIIQVETKEEIEVKKRIDEKLNPNKYIEIVKKSVSEGGFGNIGILNCTFKNIGSTSYKDITISVTYFGESGTEIDNHEATILKVIKANSTIKIRDFNLGFTSPQFSTYTISVVSAVTIP